MDRRLPPSLRGTATSDASPSRDRSTYGDRINRSHNRPWVGGANGGDSPSRARYSTLRSSSPTPPSPGGGGGTRPVVSNMNHSTLRSGSPTPPSPGGGVRPTVGATMNHSAAVSSNRPGAGGAGSSYNGVDTTTTIDGSKGSVAAGLSSYERYRSLRLQSGSSASSTSAASSDIHARAASLLGSHSPLKTTTTSAASASTGASTSVPARASSPTPTTGSTGSYTARSSSPRDLRKQRLQQQFASSGRTSPYRQQSERAASPSFQHSSTPTPPQPPPPQAAPAPPPPQLIASPPQQSKADRNEEWLDRIRKSGATGGSTHTSVSREKKSSKKSKKPPSRRSEADDDNSDDGIDRSRHRKPRKSKSGGGHSSDDNSTVGKKKKKSSKSRSSRRSTSKRQTETPSSGDDLSVGAVVEEVDPRQPPKITSSFGAPRTSIEDPSVQAALAKLAKGTSTVVKKTPPPLTTTGVATPPTTPLDQTPAPSVVVAKPQALEPATLEEPTLQEPPSLTPVAPPENQPTKELEEPAPPVAPKEAAPSKLETTQPNTTTSEPATPADEPTAAAAATRADPPKDAAAQAAASDTAPPKDEKFSSTNTAVRGWSTYRNRRSSDSGSTTSNPLLSAKPGDGKVSQYLNRRKSITSTSSQSMGPESSLSDKELSRPGPSVSPVPEYDPKTLLYNASPGVLAAPMSEGTTSNDEFDEASTSSSEGEYQVDGAPEWSVRVCVVSAIDLPANVVPTVPFSPVLKVGLVSLQQNKERERDHSSRDSNEEPSTANTKAYNPPDPQQVQSDFKKSIHVSGLTSISKARVRSTSAKVMSKRDNGSVEFHEEMRWDAAQSPDEMAFAIELSARAVMTPSNYKESPYEQTVKPLDFPGPTRNSSSKESTASGSSAENQGRLKGLFRRSVAKNASEEMDVAKAAAVVAKHLVEGEEAKSEGDESGPLFDSKTTNARNLNTAAGNPSSEINVKLLNRDQPRKPRMTDDIRLGSQLVPLSKLSWQKALETNEAARIEQWFELETAAGGSPGANSNKKSSRNPSVLLEISFSSPEVLDDSEDEIEEDVDDLQPPDNKKASFSRRASISIRSQLRKEVQMHKVKQKEEEPVLEPGVVDYICVVGAQNIGDQKSDDGASGWVNTSPECGVFEQFPPTADYHAANGRNVALPDKVEWFCFPEGCRLWRGTTPPNSEELNLVRFSAASPKNIATTIASFDACLGCTTSFSWFVLASNSDEYGSANMKTYGACIRFFVPAPTGIDPTQDDFGQSIRGAALNDKASKRLWVPMALCITSTLPIVGVVEVMLLRMCEALSSMVGSAEGHLQGIGQFFEEVASLVINYQRPIPGVVGCSIPFLSEDRLTLTVPPTNGLPALPHGASITSACRLLGANGINYVLAAMLTECKILVHSDDTANLCLVAEVMCALMYPFQWSLPYIPCLPLHMMEFIEAPLSYFLGVSSSSLRLVSPECLEDVVVIDLDNDFSGAAGLMDEAGRNTNGNTKTPTPLPASTASNIQKAVYRLLQHNDDNDDDEGQNGFPSSRSFPRTEPETQVEREFRIAVALEVAGLVRGYQDCLVIGPSSQPMFNVDKFLQIAPILFDEQRGTSLTSGLRVLSPRSRRFVSILVTCQHFHQFLEVSEGDSLSFFREVMTELEAYGSKRDLLAVKRVLSLDAQKTIDQLNSVLKRVEDKIPLYNVKKPGGEQQQQLAANNAAKAATLDFPYSLLCPIFMGDDKPEGAQNERAEGVNQISLEHLVELEKNPWRYQSFLSIELDASNDTAFVPVAEKVKLRDAIGERRYHLWKNAVERGDDDGASLLADDPSANQDLDWTELLAENGDEVVESSTAEDPGDAAKRRINDAKDRDLLRRCLEQARVAGGSAEESSADLGRDLVSAAETALRNESARRFLLAILKKRGSNESTESHRTRRRSSSSGVSKLEARAFEVLLRLGCAMLDACIEDRDYDSAYALLKLTAGLYSMVDDGDASSVLYMTQRLGHHPIYADLGVWLRAKKMHLSAAAAKDGDKDEVTADDGETDEYEAAVATLYEMLGYGIPAEELARFASRVSEENGWFRSERGQSLLLLARRICMRRDTGANSSQKTTSDIDMMSPTSANRKPEDASAEGSRDGHGSPSPQPVSDDKVAESWSEIGWVHPSAQYSSRFEKDAKRKSAGKKERSSRHMKRSAVTSMAYLGSSVLVTGALDGGVFMARNARNTGGGEENNDVGVRGIHLDWGSAGSRYTVQSSSAATDGAYGVGAVSILAATQPANQSYDALQMRPGPSQKSVTDPLDEEELLTAMEGCRVVAGTTCGDLRVWSVKDVLSAVFFASRGNEIGNIGIGEERTTHRGGEGASSSVIGGNRRRPGVDFTAGSSLTRLKFSLRGRALSGHRGGVSCVDVPSHVYRPDSIISGGADGLIKLWSLRAPGTGSRRAEPEASRSSMSTPDQLSPRTKATRSGDAMSILSGHGGRVLCVKTAWHGDRLLSGGADRTVRLWDLGGSGGKCLSSLSGHFGWVTSVKYWGPNTIISASTDRSIALWDARVRNAPLFTLRHHYAPVSDILVGARTDPIMISAGGDGTIAAWDFRRLSDSASQSPSSQARQCKVIRRPAGKLYLHDFSSRRRTYGPVLLNRGPSSRSKTVCCLGRDSVIREWDIRSGEVVSEHVTGHCDTISAFASLEGDKLHDAQLENAGNNSVDGTITTSWDGTVRVRRLEKSLVSL